MPKYVARAMLLRARMLTGFVIVTLAVAYVWFALRLARAGWGGAGDARERGGPRVGRRGAGRILRVVPGTGRGASEEARVTARAWPFGA